VKSDLASYLRHDKQIRIVLSAETYSEIIKSSKQMNTLTVAMK
jgi:hypothetical protein